MSPRISVIIPIYNMEKYLRRCLDSVTGQRYPNLEIILVNDGSTDSSGDICFYYAQKDSRIRIIQKQNGGVSAARNSGLDAASGAYVSFVDPDDWIEQDTYRTLARLLEKKEYDVIRFNAWKGNEILNKLSFDGEYSGEKLREEVLLPMIGPEKFGGLFIMGVLWLNLFKREIIEKYKIRFNTSLRRCEDRLFTITFISHSRDMLFIDRVMYHYELNGTSLSNRYDEGRWNQELIYLDALKKGLEGESFPKKDNLKYRFRNEYLLRAIMSVHHEFFSENDNTFDHKKKKVSTIIKDKNVKDASRWIRKNKISLKENLMLYMIKFRMSLFLSKFESMIFAKHNK